MVLPVGSLGLGMSPRAGFRLDPFIMPLWFALAWPSGCQGSQSQNARFAPEVVSGKSDIVLGIPEAVLFTQLPKVGHRGPWNRGVDSIRMRSTESCNALLLLETFEFSF